LKGRLIKPLLKSRGYFFTKISLNMKSNNALMLFIAVSLWSVGLLLYWGVSVGGPLPDKGLLPRADTLVVPAQPSTKSIQSNPVVVPTKAEVPKSKVKPQSRVLEPQDLYHLNDKDGRSYSVSFSHGDFAAHLINASHDGFMCKGQYKVVHSVKEGEFTVYFMQGDDFTIVAKTVGTRYLEVSIITNSQTLKLS
jgi:hypothetical protein